MNPSAYIGIYLNDDSHFERKAFGDCEYLRIVSSSALDNPDLVIVGTTEQLDHLCASLIPAEATEEVSA